MAGSDRFVTLISLTAATFCRDCPCRLQTSSPTESPLNHSARSCRSGTIGKLRRRAEEGELPANGPRRPRRTDRRRLRRLVVKRSQWGRGYSGIGRRTLGVRRRLPISEAAATDQEPARTDNSEHHRRGLRNRPPGLYGRQSEALSARIRSSSRLSVRHG